VIHYFSSRPLSVCRQDDDETKLALTFASDYLFSGGWFAIVEHVIGRAMLFKKSLSHRWIAFALRYVT